MSEAMANALNPRFLGEAGQRFFTLQFRAAGQAKGHVIFVPPFGEEMNRCRALVAEQSRALAQQGYHCTVIDFTGTGDSEGDLAQASVSLWRQNIEHTVAQVREEEALPVTLWGLRLGALLALDFAAHSETPLAGMLLWQPVTSGKRFVTQLLRQRVASLVSSGLPAETTADIRQRIAQGEAVEVSGYFVAEALIAEIEALALPSAITALEGSINWLENVEVMDDGLSTASAKAVTALRESGCTVQADVFVGPPIWQLHKRDELPELLALTSALFAA